jgi:hypothetical protein
VICFEKRLFQIPKAGKELPRPKGKAVIQVQLEGSLSVIWKGNKPLVKELTNTHSQKLPAVA